MSSLPSGYAPRFHMPVIDSAQNYLSLKQSNIVSATQVDHYALKISVNDAAHHKLFSIAGGVVYFVPQEATTDPFQLYAAYPDLPTLLPGTGFLVCGLWPADIMNLKKVLPAGVPPPSLVVYFNVNPASVIGALNPFVEQMPDASLTASPLVGDHQQHVTDYLEKIRAGKAGVFVPGGAYIGNMVANEFTLFFAGLNDPTDLSPILHIREMPDYAGQEWAGHPLIDAVSALPVPVDIFAEFNAWNSQGKSFKPLASGTTVDLMDRNQSTDKKLLTTTADPSGNGQVLFTTPDIQIIDEPKPDLYFQVHLGNQNPDPSLIADPWSTDEWVYLFGGFPYSTGDGYYDDFSGTKLGTPARPLSFHIGLGFWADLISHRPPIAVQQQLKAANRSVHFIEDPGASPLASNLAWSSLLNLDYYPIRVTKLPTVANQVFTPMDLLRHIRLDINDLVDSSLFQFKLVDLQADGGKWNSTDPADPQALQQLMGIVLKIDFYFLWMNGDDGSVVVSDIDTDQFTFSTIWTPDELSHPVSGNRQIGFTALPDGSWVFYTRGADRPTTVFDHSQCAMEFRGADISWKSLQAGIAKFVNDNGGIASVEAAFSARFPWHVVKKLYFNPTTGR